LRGYTYNCNCTYKDWVSGRAVNTGWECFPTCDWVCGPYTPWGYTASNDTIRFRAADWCDDDHGCGCGGAVKVTAPSGYVIKSITFDVKGRLQYWNGDKNAKIGVSRGMSYGLDCGAIPRGTAKTLTNMSGTVNDWRVDFHRQGTNEIGGTRYAFIYFDASGHYCEGCSRGKYINSWAEIRDIKVELVPLEISTTEVTVINNCLLSYSGVPTNNPDNGIRWPTCHNGQIRFSNNGSNWGPYLSWSKVGPWTFDWTLDPGAIGGGDTWLWAEVICQTRKICQEGPLPIVIPTGTITGNVYMNEDGVCSGVDPPTGTGTGWTVTCNGVVANKSGTQFTCVDSEGNTEIPYGTYVIDLTSPSDWRIITGGGCQQDPASVNLQGDQLTVSPPFYIWQGEPAWFQTREGDVHSQGIIFSDIPSTVVAANRYFCLLGGGGTPGVVSHGEDLGDEPWGAGVVSEAGWLAKTDFSRRSFDYFKRVLESQSEEDFGVFDGSLPAESGVYYSKDAEDIDGWNIPAGRRLVLCC